MPSRNYGWAYLVAASCLVASFYILYTYGSTHLGAFFALAKQRSYSNHAPLGCIANDTLGFQKIFVINAPWRTDRKDAISLAASYSGITLDWIDGVSGESILEKAYPPGQHRTISKGNRGSWRAHMNALREIVEQNLTTALILEDDADWDFRLRSQLSSFSQAARRLPSLISQTTSPSPPSSEQKPSQAELAKRSCIQLSSLSSRSIAAEKAYGVDWDVLWLGHCGAELPPPSPNQPNRVMIPNDQTVPEPQYLKPMALAKLDAIGTLYPPHSRIVHQANSTLCTIAYAVTQGGARKILYEFGVRDLSKGYDFALSDYCNGRTRGARKETTPMCITVQPPLFSHHFAEKMTSDITGLSVAGKPDFETRYVKRSLRMNLEALVRGDAATVEQWVDTETSGEQ